MSTLTSLQRNALKAANKLVQREAIQHADGCQLSNAECVKLIHESIEPMKCVA